MQTNLLWTGREYYSLENCLVTTNNSLSEITSVIVGAYQGEIYRVDYNIKTNQRWQTVFLELHSQHNSRGQHYILKSDGTGRWVLNGQRAPEFDDCIDVDIPLTPFTNTLPINRLKLTGKEQRLIKVVYVDVLKQTISAVTQKYARLSNTAYHYENVPNDFEATIEVDDQNFVTDYPELFVRTLAVATSYN